MERQLSVILFLATILMIGSTTPAVSMIGDRPADADGAPTEVRIRAVLVDVDQIDGVAQSFVANFYLEARWRDARLAHRGLGSVIRSLNEVWHPRLQYLNQQRISLTFPEVVEISPDGSVVYRQRVWGPFAQPLDLRDFPFDRQSFEIRVVAVGFTPEKIKFVLEEKYPSGLSGSFSQPDWNVRDWRLDISPFVPMIGGLSNPVASFAFVFEGDRKTGFYLWKIILPLLLVVCMSWVVFWIDPQQYATQIGVSMTSMLTLIAYRFMVGNELPKISYLTRMDYCMLGATLLVFFALLQAVMTAMLAKSERIETAKRIDRWCRGIFPGLFVAVLVFSLGF